MLMYTLTPVRLSKLPALLEVVKNSKHYLYVVTVDDFMQKPKNKVRY